MSGFGNSMKAVAQSLLGEKSPFARPAIIRRSVTSGPPYAPVVTNQDYPVSGVDSLATVHHADGSLVRIGDVRFALSPDSPVEPTTADKLVLAGKVLQIVKVDSPAAAGVGVTWILYARA